MRRQKFDNYVEWLGIVYAITLVCCPALRCPAASPRRACRSGCRWWRRRAASQLLAGAKVLEDILGVRGTTPVDPRPPK